MNCVFDAPPTVTVKRKPRAIHVIGDIDELSFQKFTKDFQRAMDAQLDIIPILIHSDGGEVFIATQMVSLIQSCPVPVATIVTGQAYSAGALLFSCGTEGHRYMGPHASLMLHDMAIENLDGKVHDIQNEAEEMKRTNQMLYTLMAENCGQPSDFFCEKVAASRRSDLYVCADQALEWNICNHIGVPSLQTKVLVKHELILGPQKKGGLRKSTKKRRISKRKQKK